MVLLIYQNNPIIFIKKRIETFSNDDNYFREMCLYVKCVN